MELQNALSQIAQIKRQMAITRIFRGYRAGTNLLTALAALLAAAVQIRVIPHPSLNPFIFVNLWVAVAIGSMVIVGTEIFQRYRRSESPLERELTILAIEQFLPCIIVGGLVTLILCYTAPSQIWLLPGLWPIFFGLGIFASRRLLPSPIIFVGAFYILSGLAWLAFSSANLSLSPYMMGITFGLGQTAAAAVLHFSLERRHES